MESVVLQMRCVQMSSRKFIYSVLTDYSREIVHSEKVWVVPAWSPKCCTDAGVWNLIVPLEH